MEGKKEAGRSKIKHLCNYNHTYRKLSMDAMNYRYMGNKLNKIYQNYKNDNVYFSLIGHPKAFTGEAYENLSCLLDWFLENQDKYRLVNMTDIYCDVMGGSRE